MAQPRIFISHASPDAPFANRLADDLRDGGDSPRGRGTARRNVPG